MKRPLGKRVPTWFCVVLALLAPAIVAGLIWYLSAGDDFVPLTRSSPGFKSSAIHLTLQFGNKTDASKKVI